MRKKNFVVIVLTLIVFVAISILGVTSVYRVNDVKLELSIISSEANNEADELQKELLTGYKDKNMFSANRKFADETILKFPYFRITEFKKSYPDQLVLKIVEGEEVFAVEKEDNFLILSSNGTILSERNTSENRSDNGRNIIIKGIEVQGKIGEKINGDEYIESLFSMMKVTEERLENIRGNIKEIEIIKPTSLPETTSFCIYMQEGVKINIYAPLTNTIKKANLYIDKYLSLSDQEKLGGRIEIIDSKNDKDKVLVSYVTKG